MKKIVSILLSSGLIVLCSCSNTQSRQSNLVEKSDGQKVVEAYENGDWETIVSICDTLVDETDTMNLTIPYAEALAAVGNPQKGIYILDKKLKSNPNDYYLYQTKGNVYYAMEKFDSAIVNYEKVIAIKPTYARPYINEGEIYELLGNKENAIMNYMAAAKLFLSSGYTQEMIEICRRILTLDSTNVEVKEMLNQVTE